jgi:3-oxoacyl-[acyl-carrier-protein] synthase II
MERVYVTGVGVVSSLGYGREAFLEATMTGRSAAREVALFDTSGMDRHIACEVHDFRPRDFLSAAETRRTGRCSQFALVASRMAVEHAGLREDQLAGSRTGVIFGTTMGEANLLGQLDRKWIHEGEHAVSLARLPAYGTTLLPIHVARAVGATGMVQTLPAACAAGNYAIGYAADQIRLGRADVVICGASEVIEKLQYAGFLRLGAMAPDRARPFDKDRNGLLVGEGAGALVLESARHAEARGATLLAEVGGYGLACDAHHITRPEPSGAGSARAMRDAIRTSGLRPRDVTFINAHGTATPTNDTVESRVVRDIFGDYRVPLTSLKGAIGHCMGAASAIEAVSCVLSIVHGVIPPTINFETLDPVCDVDVVTNATSCSVDVVLNNSLAFGGYDAVVTFARPGHLPEPYADIELRDGDSDANERMEREG